MTGDYDMTLSMSCCSVAVGRDYDLTLSLSRCRVAVGRDG